MDAGIFRKMKAKAGMTARVLHAPEGYPRGPELDWTDTGAAAFVHLFVESAAQFEALFPEAAQAAAEGALLWLSYPKGSGKQRYDINRDSLWDLLIPRGWHPVAQVSLDDQWSAVRVRPNEAGKAYVRPNNRKASD